MQAEDSEQVFNLMAALARFEGYHEQFRVDEKIVKDICSNRHDIHILVTVSDTRIVGYLVCYFSMFTYDMKPRLFIKELFVEEIARRRSRTSCGRNSS